MSVLLFRITPSKSSWKIQFTRCPTPIAKRGVTQYPSSNSNPNPEDLEDLAFALNDFELTRQVSIEEVERTNLIQDPMEAVPNIPFGHCNARWVVFKDSLQGNETLWEFESTRSELKGVQAMWGYAVKRDGRVDRFMTTGWRLNHLHITNK